jgi:glucuronokinase
MNYSETDIIRTRAYARVGLVGNPSDGYFGKTLSFTFRNFYAEVVMYPSRHLELLPGARDRSIYSNLDEVVQSIQQFGYYGGIRLLQASLKRFMDYCQEQGIKLETRNFSMRYFTNIPSRVGMAGSSAIITACFRALMRFYNVDIPREELANVILSVESEELGIGAGLQDRVAQVYQGLTFMDFDRDLMERQGHGHYESLNTAGLTDLYVAYKQDISEGSEVFHNDLRARFDSGEPAVVEAMQQWAGLAEEVKGCLLKGDQASIGPLLNANFDLRRRIYRIHPDNIAMVETARAVGASAKFTGSGGAIVGTVADDAMFESLVEKLSPLNVHVFKPEII